MNETIDARTVEQAKAAVATAGAVLYADPIAGWRLTPDGHHHWDGASSVPTATATLRTATLGEALDLCRLLVAMPTPETVEATPKRTAARRTPLAPNEVEVTYLPAIEFAAAKPAAALVLGHAPRSA